MAIALAFPEAGRTLGRALAQAATRVDAVERHRPGHAARVALLADRLGRRLGLAETDVFDVVCAALAHGVGLLPLASLPLDRAGALTTRERLDLWRHPLFAEQHLAKRGASRHAQLVARWYHEWWNGLGYPDMLSGESIPVGARILRVAECYDALRAERPYRPALDSAAALDEVRALAGIEFDPYVVKHFVGLLADEPALDGADVAVDAPERLAPIRAAHPAAEPADV